MEGNSKKKQERKENTWEGEGSKNKSNLHWNDRRQCKFENCYLTVQFHESYVH